ncbi:hypothetical protein [Acaryochloris sp. IP29b_bin.148]|uniref:hypothetical protein n=1 Tax=Acaryochloris sp. IP29b_bin.148 TaxID=2969218 RepID=UPI002616B062|nr:hypothetical protein [Acaryochloris sp. IP29b_bin.148]
MFGRQISRKIVPVAIALGCLSAIGFLQTSKLAQLSTQADQVQNSLKYETDLRHQQASLKLLHQFPDFGFDNLVADWVFLNFLQYFGDNAARKRTGYGLSPDFFEVIIKRDPRFIRPYLFLSTSVSLKAGQPQRSVQLLDTGLQSLDPKVDPNAYLVWLYKATDELLFLGDNQSARNSHQKVVEWSQENSDPDSQRLSALSARTAKFLANKPNSKRAQINSWLLVLVNAVDNNGRQRAIKNIKRLGGEISFGKDGSVTVIPPRED